jgi:nickel superoxide dismutase
MNILQKLSFFMPLPTAYAHCDVPCGIYDPKAAQTAAQTVAKMVEKIMGLEKPNADDKMAMLNYKNTLTRCILTKEEHGRKCKEELFILWADFFKPEHLEKYPNLHDVFWKAVKLCSKNKQEINQDLAHELVNSVDEIAGMVKSIQEG